MSILGNFGRLQAVRRSLQQVLRPLEPHLTVPVSISQARTRIMPPPYREENLQEKGMERISGVSQCPRDCLCSKKIEISYKNTQLLTQFVSQQTGCIIPRTITKVCIKMQLRIAKEIKKARTMGYMPYTETLLKYHTDPKLFNISRARDEKFLQIRMDKQKTRTQRFQPYKLGQDT